MFIISLTYKVTIENVERHIRNTIPSFKNIMIQDCLLLQEEKNPEPEE